MQGDDALQTRLEGHEETTVRLDHLGDHVVWATHERLQ